MDTLAHAPHAGNLFIIAAPSGGGKSSLVAGLLRSDPSIHLSISCTTRAPRPGEEDGREYHFVTSEAFEAMREAGELLEWAKVHGNYYGTPRRWIQSAMSEGRDAILEIDWQGARQVRQHFPSAVGVFIVPPSIEVLEERLHRRGQDDPQVIARRLVAAGGELAHAPEFEYVIINQEFSVALQELETIIRASRLRYASQSARHTELFAQLGILNDGH